MRKLVLAAVLLLGAAAAQAQESDPTQYPMFSLKRVTIGARAEYAWWTGADSEQLPNVPKEFGVGLASSYALVPKLQATFRTVYFVDSRITQFALGVNLKLYEGQ